MGAGLIDAYAAAHSVAQGPANLGLRAAKPLASTLYPVVYGQPLARKSATQLGTNWTLYRWAALPWTSPAWDNLVWNNIVWDNIAWDNLTWAQPSWDNMAWDSFGFD
jgi:hypothetical protein